MSKRRDDMESGTRKSERIRERSKKKIDKRSKAILKVENLLKIIPKIEVNTIEVIAAQKTGENNWDGRNKSERIIESKEIDKKVYVF
jgi:hypothetical protein